MGVSTLSGLVAALLAAVAPSAAARQPPASAANVAAHVTAPAHIRVLRPVLSQADKRTRTCNARGSNRQANPVERKLAPVACEQPPRSKVILTFEGGLFGSGR
jgi:hypothetical protein